MQEFKIFQLKVTLLKKLHSCMINVYCLFEFKQTCFKDIEINFNIYCLSLYWSCCSVEYHTRHKRQGTSYWRGTAPSHDMGCSCASSFPRRTFPPGNPFVTGWTDGCYEETRSMLSTRTLRTIDICSLTAIPTVPFRTSSHFAFTIIFYCVS